MQQAWKDASQRTSRRVAEGNSWHPEGDHVSLGGESTEGMNSYHDILEPPESHATSAIIKKKERKKKKKKKAAFRIELMHTHNFVCIESV